MVIEGAILTPIAKLVTIKGLAVGLFIRYALLTHPSRGALSIGHRNKERRIPNTRGAIL